MTHLHSLKSWGSELLSLRKKHWGGDYSVQQGEKEVAVMLELRRTVSENMVNNFETDKRITGYSFNGVLSTVWQTFGNIWFYRHLCLLLCLIGLFYDFVNCTKLMVMQMIYIHRDTNKLCSAIDFRLVKDRISKNYILLPWGYWPICIYSQIHFSIPDCL